MPLTITVTGGFTGSVTADLADSLKQLATATFKMALVPAGSDDPPAVGNAAWKHATATQTDSTATVSLAIDDTFSVGAYNLAIDIVSSGRHENAWAVDRRGRRSLVVVT